MNASAPALTKLQGRTFGEPGDKNQLTPVCLFQLSKTVAAPFLAMGLLSALIGIILIVFGGAEARMLGIVYCTLPVGTAFLGFIMFAAITALYNLVVCRPGGIAPSTRTDS